jgi:hypothetical protein
LKRRKSRRLKLKMAKKIEYKFTTKELGHIENMVNDAILRIFNTQHKRYELERTVKKAYLLGREMNLEVLDYV